MNQFHDATLLLVGHGSTLNGASAVSVRQHAASLSQRGLFAEVRAAFWMVEPRVVRALAETSTTRVFIVPFFTSEGYFTQQAIPRELGLLTGEPPVLLRTARRGGQTFHYCRPVGTHPAMTDLIVKRAMAAIAGEAETGDCALVIVGHGTNRNPGSRRALERQVARIAVQRQFAEVHAVFIEEQPGVADAYAMTRASSLVVVPFFMSDGLHAAEDIPMRLGEVETVVRDRLSRGEPGWINPTTRHGRRVWLTPSVGGAPEIAEVIMSCVLQAAGSDQAAGKSALGGIS